MTNYTKKRTNTSEDRPSASTSAKDPDIPTLEELQERNEELERRLRKYKGLSYLLALTILTLYYRKAEIYKSYGSAYDQTDYSP
jgi:hypothetical protein